MLRCRCDGKLSLNTYSMMLQRTPDWCENNNIIKPNSSNRKSTRFQSRKHKTFVYYLYNIGPTVSNVFDVGPTLCGNERCVTQQVVVAIATACLWRGIDTIRPETLSRSRRVFVSAFCRFPWKHTRNGWQLLVTTIVQMLYKCFVFTENQLTAPLDSCARCAHCRIQDLNKGGRRRVILAKLRDFSQIFLKIGGGAPPTTPLPGPPTGAHWLANCTSK